MAARWQQWMPFHIDRWKGSPHVQAMRPTARAGYLYLLTAAWQTEDCSLPSEDEELVVLAGLTDEEWAEHGAKIRRRFSVGPDRRMFNPVLRREWADAKRVFESRQDGARRTNRARRPGDERVQTIRGTSRSSDTQTLTVTATKTEKKTPGLSSSLDADVERIYLTYPRKAAKVKGLEAIKEAIEHLTSGKDLPVMTVGDALSFLHEKVMRFAQSPAGNAGEYTPHPSTWFNQQRYLDDEREWQHGNSWANSYNIAKSTLSDRALNALERASAEDPGADHDVTNGLG
jgi:uncharacterized protein YdaU (DUF1376 family)